MVRMFSVIIPLEFFNVPSISQNTISLIILLSLAIFKIITKKYVVGKTKLAIKLYNYCNQPNTRLLIKCGANNYINKPFEDVLSSSART